MGGRTWAKADTLGSKPGGSLVNDNGISFVLFDSASGVVDGATKTFFVGIGRTSNNFYRTDDGGKTFAPVAGGPAGLMPLRAVVAGRSILVSYAGGPGPHSVTRGAIWRHGIVAGTWTTLTPKDADGYFGDGSQARDFTYVDDIARGTILAARPLGYEIINLGGGQRPTTLMELIAAMEERLGKKAVIDHKPFNKADMMETWADISKAKRLLGWEPEITLEEGLDRTIGWYRENRDLARALVI